jgi:hypothetical protein
LYSGRADEADRSIIADRAIHSPAVPQMVQMRDRLAHREKALLQVELAPFTFDNSVSIDCFKKS